MTIHFVYTVPGFDSKNFLFRIYYYLYRHTKIVPPLYRNPFAEHINWPSPVCAPHSITYHLLEAFKKKAKVKLYDWNEKCTISLKPDDIFIAHPKPEFNTTPWTLDKSSVTYKTLEANPSHTKTYIISPYNNDISQVGFLKEIFQNYTGDFIAICGSLWMDDLQKSPLKGLIKNIYHTDMAIDSANYPQAKEKFNPKGKRKFLYIGRCTYPKNTEELEKIAQRIPGFQGGYISSGNITGWKKIADFADLTPEYMKKLAEEYDVFLSTSIADAQATTVLEQMCFGLAIAATPESGYTYASIFKLDKYDTSFNCAQLEYIQNMEEKDLLELSVKNRQIAQELHSWEKFCNNINKYITI